MAPGPVLAGDTRALLLREIGDDLDIGVMSVDTSLVITGWNRWLERATGTLSVEVVGTSLRDLESVMRPGTIGAFERAVGGSNVILSHALHGYVFNVSPPSGYEHLERMQQHVRILPSIAEDGTVLGAVALVQDVTERVAREAELRRAMEDAQRANQAKSDFLAAMSHELRTPIGAVSGYADIMADGMLGPVSPSQRDQLGRIKTVAGYLLGIVDEILTFARLGAGREDVRLTDADAAALVREAVVAVAPQAAKKRLELVCPLPESPVMIRTDAMKVRQILINLIGNAVKFTTHGKICVELKRPTEGMISFEISDTGQGIAPDDVARIFEPFVQISKGVSRTHEGSGLGLAVSQELVRLLGGELTVASTPGAGSVFTATIPV